VEIRRWAGLATSHTLEAARIEQKIKLMMQPIERTSYMAPRPPVMLVHYNLFVVLPLNQGKICFPWK
jgi:hypothetical protein